MEKGSAGASLLLADDHAALDAVFRALYRALDDADRERAHHSLDLLWARLAVHIRAEHLRLFPAILHSLDSGSTAGVPENQKEELRLVIAELRLDHDFFMHTLAGTMKTMRALSAAVDGSVDAEQWQEIRRDVAAVEERMLRHNRIEEEQVYTLPGLLLGEPAREALAAGVRAELENLPPRWAR